MSEKKASDAKKAHDREDVEGVYKQRLRREMQETQQSNADALKALEKNVHFVLALVMFCIYILLANF